MNEMKEMNEVNVVDESLDLPKAKKSKKALWRIVFYAVMVLAVAGLYVLHFVGAKEQVKPLVPEGTPGTGEILFVNIDSISEKYELVKILTTDIETEISKQNAIFENKEKAFQAKYGQFQKNYEAGLLTEVQVQNTTNQLQEEYQTILQDKQRVLSGLEERQVIALNQVSDSIKKVATTLNKQKYNASYIFIYQNGAQLLYGDPTKDITLEVLEVLNSPYKK